MFREAASSDADIGASFIFLVLGVCVFLFESFEGICTS